LTENVSSSFVAAARAGSGLSPSPKVGPLPTHGPNFWPKPGRLKFKWLRPDELDRGGVGEKERGGERKKCVNVKYLVKIMHRHCHINLIIQKHTHDFKTLFAPQDFSPFLEKNYPNPPGLPTWSPVMVAIHSITT
jgi:hypothetical protein